MKVDQTITNKKKTKVDQIKASKCRSTKNGSRQAPITKTKTHSAFHNNQPNQQWQKNNQ